MCLFTQVKASKYNKREKGIVRLPRGRSRDVDAICLFGVSLTLCFFFFFFNNNSDDEMILWITKINERCLYTHSERTYQIGPRIWTKFTKLPPP